jgi:hypothetical protein
MGGFFYAIRMLKKAASREGDGPVSSLCSRNARPQKDGEEAARCPPCSQNAHNETVLVRCAQLRAALATPLKRGIGNWKALDRVKVRPWVERLSWQTQGGRVK